MPTVAFVVIRKTEVIKGAFDLKTVKSETDDLEYKKSGADGPTVRSRQEEGLTRLSQPKLRKLVEIKAPGPQGYKTLFEKVVGALCWEEFNIAYANRYDGRIESAPLPETGEQPRVRRRAIVELRSSDQEAVYEVEIKVFKERLDAGRTVWIPDGRDHELEGAILREIGARPDQGKVVPRK